MIKMARGMVLLILAADTPRMIQRTPQLPMMAMTRMTVKATVHMAEASVHGSEIGLVVKGKDTHRGGAAKFGLISITYHKYILGVYKYILRLEISIFDRKNRKNR